MEVSRRHSDTELVGQWTKKITTAIMAACTRPAAALCHCPQRTLFVSSRMGKSKNIRSTNVISVYTKRSGNVCLLPFQVLLLSIIILSLATFTELVVGENNRQPSRGHHGLQEPLSDSIKMMRSKRSTTTQQQQPTQTSRQAIIPAANPNFEAAFQGECGKNNKNGNPCGHICLDLYDGTYECSCFYGFTLAVDGYSCTPVANLHANGSGPAQLATSDRSRKQPPAVEPDAAVPEQRREQAKLVFGRDKPSQKPNTTNSSHVSGPQAEATSRQPADANVSFVAAYESAHDGDDEASDNNSDAKSSLEPYETRQASDLGRQPLPLPPTARPPAAAAAADTIGKPAANDNRKLATAAQSARGAESSSSNERGGKIIDNGGGGGPDELLRPRQRRLLAASAWLQRRQGQQQPELALNAGAPREPRWKKADAGGGGGGGAITESGKVIAAATTTTPDNNKGNETTARSRRLESFYYAPAEGSAASELIELNEKDSDLAGVDADIKSIMLDNDQLVDHLAALVAAAGQMDEEDESGAAPDPLTRPRRQQDLALLELFVNKTMEDYLHDTGGGGGESSAEESNQLLLPTNQSSQLARNDKTPGKLCNDSSPVGREECGRGPDRGECESGGQCLMERRWISLARQVIEQRVSRCQCPIGRGGHLCQRPTQRVVPKFMGRSYLALPMATNRPELVKLRLVFKPSPEESRQPLPSLLLYSQKFILLLDSMNRIELRYSSGLQVTRVYGSRDVLMGAWNELVVTPDASNDDNRGAERVVSPRHLEVFTEKGAWRLVAPIANRIVLVTPDRIQLDTGGELANYSTELFVAGLPDQRRRRRQKGDDEEEDDGDQARDEVISGVEGLGAAKGLRGCVGELSINGRRYKFNSDLNGDALDGFDIAECCEATLEASA